MERLNEFRALGLTEKTLKPLIEKGFEKPSPIQALTIPALLTGDKDIIGQAQTGTGKTAAFSLPILEKIEKVTGNVQAIVLAPTRELAVQVAEEMSSLSHGRGLRVTPVYGGQSLEFQRKQLKRGTDIVVGTPGRVIDLINRRILKLDAIDYFILDEADEMLNMGFVDDIEEILRATNDQKRMLFFSATMPREILRVAKVHMGEHEVLAVKKRELTNSSVDQIYFEVKDRDKFEALCRIIDIEKEFYGIVFCRTKNDCNVLVGKLNDRGYDAEGLHGDITQNHRELTLRRFKSKRINLLVATDVAARGIDVNDLTHVINYAIPQDPESYVHRIGRTGRAGKQGTAITFITPSEYRRLQNIKRVTNTDIKKEQVPGIKAVIEAKRNRLLNEVNEILDNQTFDSFKNMADEMLAKTDNYVDLVAALLKHSYDELLNEGNYKEIADVKGRRERDSRERGSRDSRDRGSRDRDSREDGDKARLFVALGKKDKMTAKKLVDMIKTKTSVGDRSIKRVEVYENFSFMTVPTKEADRIVDAFEDEKRGRKPLIEKAKARRK